MYFLQSSFIETNEKRRGEKSFGGVPTLFAFFFMILVDFFWGRKNVSLFFFLMSPVHFLARQSVSRFFY